MTKPVRIQLSRRLLHIREIVAGRIAVLIALSPLPTEWIPTSIFAQALYYEQAVNGKTFEQWSASLDKLKASLLSNL